MGGNLILLDAEGFNPEGLRVLAPARAREDRSDLAMAALSRLLQRRPAEVADVIDVDPRLQQLPDRLDMPVVADGNERGPADAIRAAQIGAHAERESQRLKIAACAGARSSTDP